MSGTLTDPRDFASRVGAWLTSPGPEADVVVSCRARLARNVAGYAFGVRLAEKPARELVQRVREVLLDGPMDGQAPVWVDLASASDLLRLLLRERHLASRELAPVEDRRAPLAGRGVAFARGETALAMVGEEDHLRLGGITAGYDLQGAFQRVRALDQRLEQHLPFAVHEQLGYLTACPTNVGTGLRASVMLNLCGLGLVRSELEKVFHAAQRTGLAVRGQYGEGSRASGDLYQISNQVTLGRSESQLLADLEAIVPDILHFERRVRAALLEERRTQLEDRVERALGILSSGASLNTDSALSHLSLVRLGVSLGLVADYRLEELNALTVQVQRGHVQALYEADQDQSSDAPLADALVRDRMRGALLQRFFTHRHP